LLFGKVTVKVRQCTRGDRDGQPAVRGIRVFFHNVAQVVN
jgi:hypothetical protein